MPQALPILQEVLGEDLDKILKVGKGDVEELISERMPKGQKGKACEAVMQRLEEVGGLRTAPKESLRIRKAKQLKQLEVTDDSAAEPGTGVAGETS